MLLTDHEVCLKGKNILKGMVPDTWFCSASCDEVLKHEFTMFLNFSSSFSFEVAF